jgi:hypothetical protein
MLADQAIVALKKCRKMAAIIMAFLNHAIAFCEDVKAITAE